MLPVAEMSNSVFQAPAVVEVRPVDAHAVLMAVPPGWLQVSATTPAGSVTVIVTG